MVIFVTVGTHEQPFARMMDLASRLAGEGHEVTIQYGSNPALPKGCRGQQSYPFPEMVEHIRQAETVITHGGTGSIMLCLQEGKFPLVVPRLAAHGEHVDDHQLQIVEAMAAEGLVAAIHPDTPWAGLLELIKTARELRAQPIAGRLPVFLRDYLRAL